LAPQPTEATAIAAGSQCEVRRPVVGWSLSFCPITLTMLLRAAALDERLE
jgi:hypothetical protein